MPSPPSKVLAMEKPLAGPVNARIPEPLINPLVKVKVEEAVRVSPADKIFP